VVDCGREICGVLDISESREWLCANGIGGFASGTVAGVLTRRYHGLLVAALRPPLGRTLMMAKADDSVVYDGITWSLFVNRWVGNVVNPHGYRLIERFRLEGTVPVWTYAIGDALIEKRIWMEPGANTTYVRYDVVRAARPLSLEVKALANYRDYHGATRGATWQMDIATLPDGFRILAFEGARPLVVRAAEAALEPAHVWYGNFDLAMERERGLPDAEDHLHAGTLRAALAPGRPFTLAISAEAQCSIDGDAALERRRHHDTKLLATWSKAQPAARQAPAWIRQLVLAADQFVARRTGPDVPDGRTLIAGYHWFGDWGRDTMIALPGLTLTAGRPDVARTILRTFAAFVDRGMIPNRFPDEGGVAEYNTADATLWYVEAIRAYHAATSDDGLLAELMPVLEDIVDWHRRGTRHGIAVDSADGLLRVGAGGVQLTWMDAKVGDWVVTPREGKPVEVNALWYNALVALATFARRLGRAAASFERFWNSEAGYCFDVVDGPSGHDDALRPNQILAVSLPASPLAPERQRSVVDACARYLLTSFGLRSLAPAHAQYRGTYGGDPLARDAAYHQGTVWAWLLGPFALAHFRVHGDRRAAQTFLEPFSHHVDDHGVGSISEIFEGDPPFAPRGCIAHAWSVAETLRAWHELDY
jgi:predicted glycogen debranching enzyme